MSGLEELRTFARDAARDLLGPGYVDSYYDNAAADFVGLAEWYADVRMREVLGNGVETAARAIHDSIAAQMTAEPVNGKRFRPFTWEEIPEQQRELDRERARAVISALIKEYHDD